MIQYQNFVKVTNIKCEDGEIFEACNFSQNRPQTLVTFTGKGIVIRDSNITNCVFEKDVETELIAYHTPKSLDEMKADTEAEAIANPPEKMIYTKEEVVRILTTAGIAKPEDVLRVK